MKKTLNFALITHEGKCNTYIEKNGSVSNEPVSVEETLRELFKPAENEIIFFVVKADNLKDEVTFDIGIIKAALAKRTEMKYNIKTKDGKSPKIYSASAKGDYPIVGLDGNGFPCKWDAKGNESTGDDKLTLIITEKKKAQKEPLNHSESDKGTLIYPGALEAGKRPEIVLENGKTVTPLDGKYIVTLDASGENNVIVLIENGEIISITEPENE